MIFLTLKQFKVVVGATALVIMMALLHIYDYTLPQSLGGTEELVGTGEDTSPNRFEDEDDSFFKDASPSHRLWSQVFGLLYHNAPHFADIKDAIKYTGSKAAGQSKEALLSRAEIPLSTIEELRAKHKAFVNDLPRHKPMHGFKKGTSGVVMIGGGRYSWLTYLSLLALRDTGCTLPVEVIIPNYSDYENEMEFCYNILPHHNAKCVIVLEVLGPQVMMKHSFRSYQYKGLALLVSSFQNVLMLDSDNLMIQNPEAVFKSDLFKKYGLITWPDYWKRTISPEFYKVALLKVDEKKRARFLKFPLALDPKDTRETNVKAEEISEIPYADYDGAIPNLSTESGQVMIDKGIHWYTLLLSLYYNVHGPNLFYRLFSLGAPGEGDKETFVGAAFALDKPYYQVFTSVSTLGYSDSKGEFHGVGIIQKDPLQDYKAFQTHIVKPMKSGEMRNLPLSQQIEKLKDIDGKYFGAKGAKPWTLHCNFPKLDPLDLSSKDDIFDKNGKHLRYRLFGKNKLQHPMGHSFDFELHQWQTMQRVVCRQRLRFPYLDKYDGDICVFLGKQVEFLEKNPI